MTISVSLYPRMIHSTAKLKFLRCSRKQVQMKFARFERLGVVSVVCCAALAFSACTRDPNKPSYNWLHHMEDSTGVKAQHEDGVGNIERTPPEGTIPQGYQPFPCKNDEESAVI